MDLNREAKQSIDFNLFEVMNDKAPGNVPPEEIAREVRRIVLCQQQRARQSYGAKTEMLHHPLPSVVSTRRMLDLVDAYFHVGRGVLWRFNLEPLATTVRSQTRNSARWLGAVAVWRQMTEENQDYVRRSVSDVQLALNWERHRVAYSVDPGLHQALRDTDPGGTLIPPQVLRQLPHDDPIFLLPHGVPVVVGNGEPGVMRAFFLRGLGTGQFSISTADERATHYQLCALTSLGPPDAAPHDWDLSGVSVPLDQPFTVDSVAHLSASRWDSRGSDRGSLDQIQAWTRTILEVCLPVVMYCCSVNADTQLDTGRTITVRPRKNGKRQAEKDVAPTRTYNLGYRVGPILTKAAERRTEIVHAGSLDVGTAKRRRPHIRRAHWHTYWYGPRDGVRTPKLKWVEMRIVNEDLAKSEITVIPVR